jgi:hypothetical protein
MHTSSAQRKSRRLAYAGLLIALGYGAPTCARTITVTSDLEAAFGVETLSKALFDVTDGDTIDFDLGYPATIKFNFELDINKDVTIAGPGSDKLTLDGNHDVNFFMLRIGAGHTVTLSGLQISNAAALALENQGTLTLNNIAMSSNSGCLTNRGTLSVNDSLFSLNSGANFGGALANYGHATVSRSNFVNNSAGIGGAAAFTNNSATLVVNDSAFVGNLSGGGNNAGRGGAILNFGDTTVNDSTLNGNVSAQFGTGGAIESNGALSVNSSTLNGNVAENGGTGISNYGTATVRRTIVSGSCIGTAIASAGDNIGTDASCFADSAALNDRRNLDPVLGGLGDYGGTVVIGLRRGSPAIDAVTVNAATCGGTDQRGAARPLGVRCDIGAFEFDPDPIFANGFE